MGELELTRDSSSSRWGIAILGSTLTLVGIVLAGIYYRSLRKQARKANAYELARSRIDRLLQDQKSAAPTHTVEGFFVEISGAIRQYLEHRFDLRAPDLTTDEFLQLASAESLLSRDHQILLRDFLQQADVVKFAGVSASPDDVLHSSQLAIKFLEETRENAPDVEIEGDSPNSAKMPTASESEGVADV